MGPRKRSKPNPKEDDDNLVASEDQKEATVVLDSNPAAAGEPKPELAERRRSSQSVKYGSPTGTRNWPGGPWPKGNKSPPVTQVAKESITSAGNVASSAIASARATAAQSPLRSPAVYLARQAASSSRSLPLPLTSDQSPNAVQANKLQHSQPSTQSKEQKVTRSFEKSEEQGKSAAGKPISKSLKAAAQGFPPPQVESQETAQANTNPTGWFGWFSQPHKPDENPPSESGSNITPKLVDTNLSSNGTSLDRRNSEPEPTRMMLEANARRSWFGIWQPPSKDTDPTAEADAKPKADSTEIPRPKDDRPDETASKAETSLEAAENLTKSYGWAFWSRDRGTTNKDSTSSDIGQLAESGSPSQSKPESATVDKSKGLPDRLMSMPKSETTKADSLRPNVNSEDKESRAKTVETASPSQPVSKSIAAKSKPELPNLLLPSFKSTYKTASRPGLIQQLSRLFQLGVSQEVKHVELCNPSKIRNAIAIGIHGYFPAPLLRSVLGQPTGTSIRFADNAAQAIQKFTQNQGYSCNIEKVALEGEGRIAERVDLLWKLLLNWIDKIRKADFIMIACHSQGVPVAIMLLAKLIAFGCINSARVGICAMAGVNLGPFADYKSRWISGSAGELFDFARADSQVSKDYEAALDVILKFGVRLALIGSIDDQLVSLDSSTFTPLNHPYVYRAVFVDGRVHAPDFLTHLVGFALKLRNLGISDHGLIRELSSPLAGSLYTGEGHSRIYEDESVYHLAVEYSLETSSLGPVPLYMKRPSSGPGALSPSSSSSTITPSSTSTSNGTSTTQAAGPSSSSPNPYILPFAMRGLLEEEYVKSELFTEITELIGQFDEWKPQNKALKDVKFRLEGVRSRL